MNRAQGLAVDLSDRIGEVAIEASFTVAPGEVVAVSGASGSGKTTLLRAIAGLRTQFDGSIGCFGEPWFDSDRSINMSVESRRVGFVFQDFALFPRMSASANVRFGLSGVPRSDRQSEAMRLLQAVGLENLAERLPEELSGGERQRLALARAVALKPQALLLDEPLASLDGNTAADALRLISQTASDLNVPCLLVTHDASLASGHRNLRLEPGLPARIL